MITDADIAFMREASNDMKKGRRREVTVSYETGVPDEFTGEIENAVIVERDVKSVVTEISSERGAGDIYLDNGIKYEKGDINFDISIDLIADIADLIEFVRHDGELYAILAMDKKGIGERNRYEMIARRTV